MQIAIIGLGLIGGSLAKAYQRTNNITILGADKDASIVAFAKMADAIQAELTDDNIADCDLILLATYPAGMIQWLQDKAPLLKGKLVLDCGGTKRTICQTGFALAEKHGFTFVGGHPMAGTHQSGFKYSREDLFDGAPMVIVPPNREDIRLLDRIKQLLAPVGFGRFSVTTAEEHDELIAFTSQLPHLVSNAFIKSPTALKHLGYSAGSYQDLTRVAWLNADMWAELFLENDSALLYELDTLLTELTRYRNAISNADQSALRQLLAEGRERKREVDGP